MDEKRSLTCRQGTYLASEIDDETHAEEYSGEAMAPSGLFQWLVMVTVMVRVHLVLVHLGMVAGVQHLVDMFLAVLDALDGFFLL